MKDVHPEILLFRALHNLETARLVLKDAPERVDDLIAQAEKLIERALA